MSVVDAVRKLLDSRLDYIEDKGGETNYTCFAGWGAGDC